MDWSSVDFSKTYDNKTQVEDESWILFRNNSYYVMINEDIYTWEVVEAAVVEKVEVGGVWRSRNKRHSKITIPIHAM